MDEYRKKQVFDVLQKQLEPVLPILKEQAYAIAYEPVWAIGTGLVPDQEYLTSVYNWLHNHLTNTVMEGSCRLLYGGSVDDKTIGDLSAIPKIEGFLIGGASLDFKKLEKIVSLGT